MGLFWDLIHTDNYEGIPAAIEQLKQVLVEEPDSVSAHKTIGFLRSWQLGEMYRADTPDLGGIVAGLEEATAHLGKALEQTPGDPRIIIFKSTNEYMAAKQLNDVATEEIAKAAFLNSVDTWPELNNFVGGTTLSIFSTPGEADFTMALDYMWESLDLCADEVVDRASPLPQMQALIKDVARPGDKRACSNSWIAPHSYEGFWMFFGDLLTKAGEFDGARVMYEFSRESANYDSWKYKDVLEGRLANMEANFVNFSLPIHQQDPKYHPVAEWSCVVCHRQ